MRFIKKIIKLNNFKPSKQFDGIFYNKDGLTIVIREIGDGGRQVTVYNPFKKTIHCCPFGSLNAPLHTEVILEELVNRLFLISKED